MGTSQSHTLKSGPNWSDTKRAVTGLANRTGNSGSHCKSFMTGFANAISGGSNRGEYSKYSTFGKAGVRIANNFISFIDGVSTFGLADTLGIIAPNNQPFELTKERVIDIVLEHVSGEHNSSIDDAAAICAMEVVIREVLADCETLEDIEQKLKTVSDDDLVLWLGNFEVEYIIEYSGELFQSHIFDKCDSPSQVMNEIRNWLHKEIDERLQGELSRYNLRTPEGKQIIEHLTSEILKIWKQE